ncbi:19188_t:CDS:2, partial [Dentiscutata erythropus]
LQGWKVWLATLALAGNVMSTFNTCTSAIFVGSIIYIGRSTVLCLFKFPKECCEYSSLNSKLSGLFVLRFVLTAD